MDARQQGWAAYAQVGVAFEAMLIRQFLQPLVKETDPLAATGIGALARSIAQRDTHGFGALLASRLADHAR